MVKVNREKVYNEDGESMTISNARGRRDPIGPKLMVKEERQKIEKSARVVHGTPRTPFCGKKGLQVPNEVYLMIDQVCSFIEFRLLDDFMRLLYRFWFSSELMHQREYFKVRHRPAPAVIERITKQADAITQNFNRGEGRLYKNFPALLNQDQFMTLARRVIPIVMNDVGRRSMETMSEFDVPPIVQSLHKAKNQRLLVDGLNQEGVGRGFKVPRPKKERKRTPATEKVASGKTDTTPVRTEHIGVKQSVRGLGLVGENRCPETPFQPTPGSNMVSSLRSAEARDILESRCIHVGDGVSAVVVDVVEGAEIARRYLGVRCHKIVVGRACGFDNWRVVRPYLSREPEMLGEEYGRAVCTVNEIMQHMDSNDVLNQVVFTPLGEEWGCTLMVPWGVYFSESLNKKKAKNIVYSIALLDLFARQPTCGGGPDPALKRRSRLNNRGTGGNSKVSKPPSADPAVAKAAAAVIRKDRAADSEDRKARRPKREKSKGADKNNPVGPKPTATFSDPQQQQAFNDLMGRLANLNAPTTKPKASQKRPNDGPKLGGDDGGRGHEGDGDGSEEDDMELIMEQYNHWWETNVPGSYYAPDDSSFWTKIEHMPKVELNPLFQGFIAAKRPNKRWCFEGDDDPGNCEVVDLGGAPFCGVNAIHTAIKGSPATAVTYFKMLPLPVQMAYVSGLIDADELYECILDTIGDSQWLEKYAESLGYGLKITSPAVGWASRPHDGFKKRVIWLQHSAGHYCLVMQKQSDVENINISHIPDVPNPIRWGRIGLCVAAAACVIMPINLVASGAVHLVGAAVAGALKFCGAKATAGLIQADAALVRGMIVTGAVVQSANLVAGACVNRHEYCELGAVHYQEDNEDVRDVASRRDGLIYQDSYRELIHTVHYTFLGHHIPLEECCVSVQRWFGVKRELKLVSQTIFVHVASKMTIAARKGTDPLLCLDGVSRYREVNTDVTRWDVMRDTVDMLKWFASTLVVDAEVTNRVSLAGLTSVAAPGAASHIPSLATVGSSVKASNGGLKLMPVKGGRGMSVFRHDYESGLHVTYDGRGVLDKTSHGVLLNKVKKYRLEDGKPETVIAVAPLGPVTVEGQIAGPGAFSLTDSPTLLAAFLSRGMTKDSSLDPILDEFVSFAVDFIEPFVDGVDVSALQEVEPEEAFKEIYKDKKSAGFIKRNVDNYHRFLEGGMTAQEVRTYQSHGCFVKFESNLKRVGGELMCRPRMIMTMSDHMLMECCQVVKLIDAWNHGGFKQFQVKDMTPEDMIEKIQSLSDTKHVVTDYSAFESSIDNRIRLIEVYALVRLALRAGFFRTAQSILDHCWKTRELKSKWGSFIINTRCSGDFWTSFGNGVVNVSLMAFCAHRKGITNFRMIAEGDDGLIPEEVADPETVTRIGIKFSSTLAGTREGDCDFLKCRWVGGRRYLNVPSTLAKTLWVKGVARLKKSKQMFILRCMGNSLYHLSPGHPVLTALVNRIGRETAGHTPFKNYTRYLDRWKNLNHAEIPLHHVLVDESMRETVAQGATGFLPIPVDVQKELEESLEFGQGFEIGGYLREDQDIMDSLDSWMGSGRLSNKTEQFAVGLATIMRDARLRGEANSIVVKGSRIMGDMVRGYVIRDSLMHVVCPGTNLNPYSVAEIE